MIKLKDLLKESKRLNLFEQALPEISFQDNFANNFTTVTGNWKASADSIVSQIQKEIDQGKSLQSLAVNVSGGASKLSATNRYKGNKEPDHDFGGDPDFPGWVTFKLPNGNDRPLGQYPDGYKLIPNGNKYLAKARAENLKNLLVKHISEKLGEKFDNINVIADPVDSDSTKYARATVTSAVKKEKIPEFNIKLMDRGAGYSRPFYFLPGENPPGHKNGESLFFNWRLLAKASAVKQRLSTNPNQTFNAMNYGLGDGVSIYISKNRIEQARSAGKVDARTADSYGGDPADYEQAIWKMIQYGNSPEGKNNNQIASIYKKPLSLDKMPGSKGTAWNYVDPETGKIKVKQPLKA